MNAFLARIICEIGMRWNVTSLGAVRRQNWKNILSQTILRIYEYAQYTQFRFINVHTTSCTALTCIRCAPFISWIANIFHLFPVSVAVIQIAYQIVVKSSFFARRRRERECVYAKKLSEREKKCEQKANTLTQRANKLYRLVNLCWQEQNFALTLYVCVCALILISWFESCFFRADFLIIFFFFISFLFRMKERKKASHKFISHFNIIHSGFSLLCLFCSFWDCSESPFTRYSDLHCCISLVFSIRFIRLGCVYVFMSILFLCVVHVLFVMCRDHDIHHMIIIFSLGFIEIIITICA